MAIAKQNVAIAKQNATKRNFFDWHRACDLVLPFGANTASFVDLRCKYNSNYVLLATLATLARRSRLYSCTVHSARAESVDRGARALVPRRRITNERAGPKHTVNMKFTGAKFGSTRIIDQCSGSPLRTTWEPPPHLGPQVFRCRLQP